jgi:putative membrane protein
MGNENAYVVDAGSDEGFVKDVGSAGLMEVEISQYASQHATNARVKEFAEMMVKDHTQANNELKAIASSKNLTVTMDDKHSDKLRDLEKKTGNDFDKEFMKEMVDEHEKNINKFEKMAENGKDPELKAFAEKYLPKLRMHLDHAKQVKDELK